MRSALNITALIKLEILFQLHLQELVKYYAFNAKHTNQISVSDKMYISTATLFKMTNYLTIHMTIICVNFFIFTLYLYQIFQI